MDSENSEELMDTSDPIQRSYEFAMAFSALGSETKEDRSYQSVPDRELNPNCSNKSVPELIENCSNRSVSDRELNENCSNKSILDQELNPKCSNKPVPDQELNENSSNSASSKAVVNPEEQLTHFDENNCRTLKSPIREQEQNQTSLVEASAEVNPEIPDLELPEIFNYSRSRIASNYSGNRDLETPTCELDGSSRSNSLGSVSGKSKKNSSVDSNCAILEEGEIESQDSVFDVSSAINNAKDRTSVKNLPHIEKVTVNFDVGKSIMNHNNENQSYTESDAVGLSIDNIETSNDNMDGNIEKNIDTDIDNKGSNIDNPQKNIDTVIDKKGSNIDNAEKNIGTVIDNKDSYIDNAEKDIDTVIDNKGSNIHNAEKNIDTVTDNKDSNIDNAQKNIDTDIDNKDSNIDNAQKNIDTVIDNKGSNIDNAEKNIDTDIGNKDSNFDSNDKNENELNNTDRFNDSTSDTENAISNIQIESVESIQNNISYNNEENSGTHIDANINTNIDTNMQCEESVLNDSDNNICVLESAYSLNPDENNQILIPEDNNQEMETKDSVNQSKSNEAENEQTNDNEKNISPAGNNEKEVVIDLTNQDADETGSGNFAENGETRSGDNPLLIIDVDAPLQNEVENVSKHGKSSFKNMKKNRTRSQTGSGNLSVNASHGDTGRDDKDKKKNRKRTQNDTKQKHSKKQKFEQNNDNGIPKPKKKEKKKKHKLKKGGKTKVKSKSDDTQTVTANQFHFKDNTESTGDENKDTDCIKQINLVEDSRISFLADYGIIPKTYVIKNEVIMLRKSCDVLPGNEKSSIVAKRTLEDVIFIELDDPSLNLVLNRELNFEYINRSDEIKIEELDPNLLINFISRLKTLKVLDNNHGDRKKLSDKSALLEYVIDIGTRDETGLEPSVLEEMLGGGSKPTTSGSDGKESPEVCSRTKLTVIKREAICPECGLYFDSKMALWRHFHVDHNYVAFMCYYCKELFLTRSQSRNFLFAMTQHYKTKHNIAMKTVQKTQNSTDMDILEIVDPDVEENPSNDTKSRPKKFICGACGLNCATELNLQIHLQLRHSKGFEVDANAKLVEVIENSVQKSKKSNQPNLKVVTASKYACDVCEVVCWTGNGIATHMADRHSGKNMHFCDQCDSVLPSEAMLNNHKVWQHSSDCISPTPAAIDEPSHHKPTGTKEVVWKTPRKCGYCSCRFTNPAAMDAHYIHRHPGTREVVWEKPRKCGYCSCTFFSAAIMDDHYIAIHAPISGNSYKCMKCTGVKIFRTKYDLRLHLTSHHRTTSLGCESAAADKVVSLAPKYGSSLVHASCKYCSRKFHSVQSKQKHFPCASQVLFNYIQNAEADKGGKNSSGNDSDDVLVVDDVVECTKSSSNLTVNIADIGGENSSGNNFDDVLVVDDVVECTRSSSNLTVSSATAVQVADAGIFKCAICNKCYPSLQQKKLHYQKQLCTPVINSVMKPKKNSSLWSLIKSKPRK